MYQLCVFSERREFPESCTCVQSIWIKMLFFPWLASSKGSLNMVQNKKRCYSLSDRWNGTIEWFDRWIDSVFLRTLSIDEIEHALFECFDQWFSIPANTRSMKCLLMSDLNFLFLQTFVWFMIVCPCIVWMLWLIDELLNSSGEPNDWSVASYMSELSF